MTTSPGFKSMIRSFTLNDRFANISACDDRAITQKRPRDVADTKTSGVCRADFGWNFDGKAALSILLLLLYGHFTSGGSDDRIESILPPVFSPNRVPRSYSKLNST